MSAAVDVSPDCCSSWNKYAWVDEVGSAVRAGTLDWRVRALTQVLRKTCGTAEPDQHVPIVWRTSSALAEAIGYSQPTFRKQRDALADTGFLVEIPSGRGSQTILVLKSPGTSEVEALQTAQQALHAYCDRTGTDTLGWIQKALAEAITNRRVAATADLGGDDRPAKSTDSSGMKPQSTGDETSFHPPPLYMERLSPDSDVGCDSERGSRSPTPQPPATHQKSSSDETDTTTVVDFEHIGAIRSEWQEVSGEFGRELDEGIALKLAREYAPHLEDPERLAEGIYETPTGGTGTLAGRLARLFGNGTSLGQTVSFLLEDVETFRVPSSSPPEPNGESTDVETARAAETVEEGSKEHFDRRVAEVVDDLGGLAHFDEAEARVEKEWRANGWSLPDV
jgi:hypothetical protein